MAVIDNYFHVGDIVQFADNDHVAAEARGETGVIVSIDADGAFVILNKEHGNLFGPNKETRRYCPKARFGTALLLVVQKSKIPIMEDTRPYLEALTTGLTEQAEQIAAKHFNKTIQP